MIMAFVAAVVVLAAAVTFQSAQKLVQVPVRYA
jgi:hypothetical protein